MTQACLPAGSNGFRGAVPAVVWASVSAAVAVMVNSAAQAHVGLSLGDETWLWYGVQRTLAGEIPLRDFQSYDPGRYLFFSAWLRLCGSDHLVPLRYAMAFFQWTAMVPALLLLLRLLPNRAWLLPLALAMGLWIAPRHKTIDINAIAWTMLAVVALIDRPIPRQYRLLGLCVGLVWLIGRNHVLYAALTTILAVAALAVADRADWRACRSRLIWLTQGTATGALPMLLILLTIPHYLHAYWDIVIDRQIEIGATNLTLPVPWPWRCGEPWETWSGLSARAVGLGFVLIPLAVFVAAVLLLQAVRRRDLRRYAVLLAAAAACAGWANHAFSRADLPHLAQAGMPLFLLLVAIPIAFTGPAKLIARIVAWGSLAVLTLFAMPVLNPWLSARLESSGQYEWYDFAGERLYIPHDTVAICQSAADVVHNLRPGESALFVPYNPGLYAEFRLRCPIFESYEVYPATNAEQRRAIRALRKAKTTWVLFWPHRMDGRADLGFDRTDALIWQYIQGHFIHVATLDSVGGAQVWRQSAVP